MSLSSAMLPDSGIASPGVYEPSAGVSALTSAPSWFTNVVVSPAGPLSPTTLTRAVIRPDCQVLATVVRIIQSSSPSWTAGIVANAAPPAGPISSTLACLLALSGVLLSAKRMRRQSPRCQNVERKPLMVGSEHGA